MKHNMKNEIENSDKNGKLFFLIAVFIIFLLSISYRLFAQTDIIFSAEAEAEELQSVNLELVNDSTASNNYFLRMPDSGSVSLNLEVPADNYYNIVIRYRAFESSKEEYLDINKKKITIGFGYSEEWNNFEQNIYLVKGINNLTLHSSWGNFDIDKISVRTTTVSPSIKPKNNSFYKSNPRDIKFILDNYKSEIQSVEASGVSLNYEIMPFPFKEESVFLNINKEELLKLENGSVIVEIKLSNNQIVKANLNIESLRETYGLTIIAPDVEHGTAMIFILPNNEVLLVDCGKDWVRDNILIPLLDNNGIEKIDHFIITHYHDDHDSGDRGEKIKELFYVTNFYDYKSFSSGNEFNIGDVKFKILNSYGDGNDENSNSLSFKMEYNGFIYQHGGDTYSTNQNKILSKFPDDVKADVFYANHHFHGSINPEYIKAIDPKIILVQAQEAIYARSAYMDNFKRKAEKFLKSNSDNYIECLPALEVGTTVIRVNDKMDWIYETYSNNVILDISSQ